MKILTPFLKMRSLCSLTFLMLWSALAYSQGVFVGSDTCTQCHQAESANWQQSHHWQAMAEATQESVLGDFSNTNFDYFGTTSTFYTDDNKYYVRTDNSHGELEDFEIKYTFGFYPLQQYLIEFPDGRIQTLSISWDSRQKEEGGQRWYHLYPGEKVDFNDPLHWTGSFLNWNSRCASCHSSNVEKNYSLSTNTYETSFSEINVGCESCHGAGETHLAWANGDRTSVSNGLAVALEKIWQPAGTEAGQIEAALARAEAINPDHYSAQKELCASCHSRRSELAHQEVGGLFLDNNSLSTLSEGLYYPDGQMQDEVYVYGSFLQSKMHQNQVSCSNCHEPHTQELVIQGNGLCLQCHSPADFETVDHYFHEQGSAGAQCVNCHMPATTYMGVDERRDHSFRIPDPFASLNFAVPNACSQCHLDQDLAWVLESFTALTGGTEAHYSHTNILDRARGSDPFVMTALLNLVEDDSAAPIVRASALVEAGRFPSQETLNVLINSLQADDALIRANAVKSLSFIPVQNRYQALQAMINDPVKSVRIEVARQLSGLPLGLLSVSAANDLRALFAELIAALNFNVDMPGAMSDLGLFYLNNNELQKAEESFLQAKKLAPAYLPALLNLADLYRTLNREAEGEDLLKKAVTFYPESANAHHALGLLYIRTQRVDDSIASLKLAAELEPANARFTLVYSVALESIGELLEAIVVLEQAVVRFPTDDQLYQILQDYSSRR